MIGSTPPQSAIDAMTAVYGVSTFWLHFLQLLPKFNNEKTIIKKMRGASFQSTDLCALHCFN